VVCSLITLSQIFSLEVIAHRLRSYPSEPTVETMGGVVEKICEVQGGSETSTNKKDMKYVTNEMIVCWNGPNISKYDSIVMQALNLHFSSNNERSQMNKVSIVVVDRINRMKPGLTFMSWT